jgi:hypothetical protein
MRIQEFSLINIVPTSSRAHPTSYPMDTADPFPMRKEAEA